MKTEEFISKAKIKHGDKYDYSLVNSPKSRDKVTIICPIHGEFEQNVSSHLSGNGCPTCGKLNSIKTKQLSQQDFIQKAKDIHGDKYDYSKSVFSGMNNKITVVCPKHGEFTLRANSHVNSQKVGCPKCAIEYRSKQRSHTTEEFIEKSKLIHGDFYDYSRVNYINLTTPVIIVCPIHGEFKQAPRDHLQGCKCKKCSLERDGKVFDTHSFISKAKKIHNNFYDYSKVEYKNSSTKVCIICPKHGEFWQTPNSHLSGHKCPKCPRTKNENIYSFDQIIERFIDIYDNKYKYIYNKELYKNVESEIEIICPEHGIFKLPIIRHLHGQECPMCTRLYRESKGEKIVKSILNELNVEFIQEYHGDFLGNLSYDFYLPKLKIAIEYNGKQHYEPVEYFGGEEAFIKQVERDNRKKLLSNDNNIVLIEIKYNQEKKDLEKMKNLIITNILINEEFIYSINS